MNALEHFAKTLFQSRSSPVADATGLSLIEAAGEVGEARLVARQIRTWMNDGVVADSIIVAARDLPAKLPLLREVFDEYAVPAIWPIPESIAECGAIKLLRKAWPLAANDFPFREVAAIWRNTYFRPAFEPDLPLRAETLLRQLDVPRGRDAYLGEVLRTAEDRLPLPLEDESMDSPQREARSQLAKRCLGLFQWFFGLWEPIPPRAAAAGFANHVRRLAKEIGIAKSPMPGKDDESALVAFGAAIDEWVAESVDSTFTKAEFARVLESIALRTAWPKPVALNGVRVLAVEDAAGTECTRLIMLGLSEGSFPQLAADPGDDFDVKLAAEKALFKKLVTTPNKELVLSRPALNAKGQSLLPASFLLEVKSLFMEIPTTTQTMLIDGYLTWPPISPAEIRAQTALAGDADLSAAKRMATARFRTSKPNPFSGTLSHPPIVRKIAEEFGAKKVFSPTSLETYVACPFRFWLEKVLGVEALEEPTEDVDVSRRGSTIHRTLKRYHEAKPHERPESLAAELETTWVRAAMESADRAPSAAAKALWHLERRRVQRAFNRYPIHWETFRGGWQKQGATPTPHEFEAMFGYAEKGSPRPELRIIIDDVEVRIGGIIDRIDLAELDAGYGFWIIDYKTGSGTPVPGERFAKVRAIATAAVCAGCRAALRRVAAAAGAGVLADREGRSEADAAGRSPAARLGEGCRGVAEIPRSVGACGRSGGGGASRRRFPARPAESRHLHLLPARLDLPHQPAARPNHPATAGG